MYASHWSSRESHAYGARGSICGSQPATAPRSSAVARGWRGTCATSGGDRAGVRVAVGVAERDRLAGRERERGAEREHRVAAGRAAGARERDRVAQLVPAATAAGARATPAEERSRVGDVAGDRRAQGRGEDASAAAGRVGVGSCATDSVWVAASPHRRGGRADLRPRSPGRTGSRPSTRTRSARSGARVVVRDRDVVEQQRVVAERRVHVLVDSTGSDRDVASARSSRRRSRVRFALRAAGRRTAC